MEKDVIQDIMVKTKHLLEEGWYAPRKKSALELKIEENRRLDYDEYSKKNPDNRSSSGCKGPSQVAQLNTPGSTPSTSIPEPAYMNKDLLNQTYNVNSRRSFCRGNI